MMHLMEQQLLVHTVILVTVSGTTNNQSSGLSETRPINFGVNYIIKI